MNAPTITTAVRSRSGAMLAARLRALPAVLLLAALVMLAALTGAPAGAVPPGGPSPDTEGTAGTVSPRTLRAGDVIAFSISGFPGGETVSVKVDDGDFCSAKGVHGACVVHQQKIAADGTVKGSFAIPSDLPKGKHWLRFLASEEILDDEGRYKGVKPYSLKGNSDFEIVTEAAAGSGSGSAGDPQSTDQGGDASTDGSSTTSDDGTAVGTTPGASGSVASAARATDGPLAVPAPPGSTEATTPAPDAGSEQVVPAAAPADTSAQEEPAFPFVGAVVLALALAGAVLLSRGRRTA